MIKKTTLFVAISVLSITSLFSQTDFKLMFYNVLNFPLEDAVPNRLSSLDLILDDYKPDIFMVCELNNVNGADIILNALQTINPNYDRAVFEFNTSDDNIGNQNELQQLIYFDSTKFTLESQTIIPSIYRDFNHYKLRINSISQATNPIDIDVIVCHLKSSSGGSNQVLRLQMIEDLMTYLDNLPTDSNVVLAGDFNVYTSSEPAFQRLIDTNNAIVFVDPADRIGSWHNNTNFVDVMTQSTRTQNGLGGASGGFDDRFDFIMTSENMSTNQELSFISGSYDVYGNNANTNCYNQSINSSNCAGSEFSVDIRTALYNFSDHLPVTLELQTNQTLGLPEISMQKSWSIVGSNIIDDILKIEVNTTLAQHSEWIIFDSLGRVIKTVDVNNSLVFIDVSDMSNGIYYITSSKFQIKPLKFVVNR